MPWVIHYPYLEHHEHHEPANARRLGTRQPRLPLQLLTPPPRAARGVL